MRETSDNAAMPRSDRGSIYRSRGHRLEEKLSQIGHLYVNKPLGVHIGDGDGIWQGKILERNSVSIAFGTRSVRKDYGLWFLLLGL